MSMAMFLLVEITSPSKAHPRDGPTALTHESRETMTAGEIVMIAGVSPGVGV